MRNVWSSLVGLTVLLYGTAGVNGDDNPVKLEQGVRGLVTLATSKVTMDGSLREWSESFCTPVQYQSGNLSNRAAQFYYLWDDEAFYIGLRCLDEKQANPAALQGAYDGDAVEFYLDTRSGSSLRGKEWSTGAIHFYYSPFEGREVKPRWVMRRGIATSNVELKGIEIAASRKTNSYEVEFKLPWSNFPEFHPKLGSVMAIDAELCYGDGDKRTDRSFAYGSPLSVQQPASLGKVQLVKAFDPEYFAQVGPAAFPMWVDTPWVQSERGIVQAVVAIAPSFAPLIGEVEIRVHDTDGKVVKTLPAQVETFGPEGLGFVRAVARWSVDDFAPGTYLTSARVATRTGKALVSVAPRLVAEGIISGR